MKILALETSTACGSVAVLVDGEILSFEKSMSPRSHAEFMNPAVEKCLAEAHLKISDVDVFACGLGPGSFTGLRVSGNIAKSFSMTFKKPLVAVDSLTLLKEGARSNGAFLGDSYLCLINAFKNMLYVALFQREALVVPPTAMSVPQVLSLGNTLSAPTLGLGDGFVAFAGSLGPAFLAKTHRNEIFSDHPLASTLAELAERHALAGQTMDWKSFKPLYIRSSEAEETLKLKH